MAYILRNVSGKRYKSDLSMKPYQTGTMNDVVYPCSGPYEDFAYSASWQPKLVVQNCSGFKSSGSLVRKDTHRIFVYLVEQGPNKHPNPSTYGNEDEWTNQGFISRNILMSDKLYQMTVPKVSIIHVNLHKNIGKISLFVKGCMEVDSLKIEIKENNNGKEWEQIQQIGNNLIKNRTGHQTIAFKIDNKNNEDSKISIYKFRAVMSCDSSYGKKLKDTEPPQTHFVRMRTQKHYKASNKKYRLYSYKTVYGTVPSLEFKNNLNVDYLIFNFGWYSVPVRLGHPIFELINRDGKVLGEIAIHDTGRDFASLYRPSHKNINSKYVDLKTKLMIYPSDQDEENQEDDESEDQHGHTNEPKPEVKPEIITLKMISIPITELLEYAGVNGIKKLIQNNYDYRIEAQDIFSARWKTSASESSFFETSDLLTYIKIGSRDSLANQTFKNIFIQKLASSISRNNNLNERKKIRQDWLLRFSRSFLNDFDGKSVKIKIGDIVIFNSVLSKKKHSKGELLKGIHETRNFVFLGNILSLKIDNDLQFSGGIEFENGLLFESRLKKEGYVDTEGQHFMDKLIKNKDEFDFKKDVIISDVPKRKESYFIEALNLKIEKLILLIILLSLVIFIALYILGWMMRQYVMDSSGKKEVKMIAEGVQMDEGIIDEFDGSEEEENE